MSVVVVNPAYRDRVPRLCYIDGDTAYFTTQPIDEQWGDDWNDAPYDCNAGRPYRWTPQSEGQEYKVLSSYWAGPLVAPNNGVFNVELSVKDINSGAVPWLRTTVSESRSNHVHIFAGATFEEFVTAVRALGGTVGELQEVKE